MSHSGRSLSGLRRTTFRDAARPFDPSHFAGFSYFLGSPDRSQRSQIGADPAEARRLLVALASAMPNIMQGQHYWRDPLLPGTDPDENPFIPAGYTYLSQLVAHDLVFTTVPFWIAADNGFPSRNVRQRGLALDTLYGGGPAASPAGYALAGNSATDRSRLRTGRYLPALGEPAGDGGECPFRDLARINPSPPTAPANLLPANFDDAFVTCVADARNDDNLIVMQLAALFASVHNVIAGQSAAGTIPETAFARAQCMMRSVFCNIIEKDLLRRILHPHVLAELPGHGPHDHRWLWKDDNVPLEFSHGSFRIGHAMVRRQYLFNAPTRPPVQAYELVQLGRSEAEMRFALREVWVIQWSRFFELPGGQAPNFARRISPTLSMLDAQHLFADEASDDSLTTRDFLSAAFARAWTVDALIDGIRQRDRRLIPADWVFSDANHRRALISQWLRDACAPNLLTAADIATLAKDPPLPLFMLLESALDPAVRGRHFGVLGSIITGEVIGQCLARERASLAPLMNRITADWTRDFVDDVTRITTMGDFIDFARRHRGLDGCAVPFA